MSESLKTKTIRGLIWTATSNFGQQGIQFVVTIILARLLTPKDFGIIGIAWIFIGLAAVINQLGIGSAIVQRKDIEEAHLSSAFWANIIMGIILCLLTIIFAPVIASFFKNQQVTRVLQVLSLIFILGSLRIVPNSLLIRDLFFNKLAYVNISALFISGLISIILAFSGYGVWSLVWGRLINVIVGLILIWFLVSWRPLFYFNVKKFKELFLFGINVLGTNLVTHLQKNSDYFIVGKYLGASSLGIYTMAYNMVTLPQRKLSTIITSVAFPAFSKIQDEPEKIREGFFTMISSISFVTFPILAGLCAVAPEFVKVILGNKWISAIRPIQILCIPGALYSIGTTVGSVFYAKGRPDLEFKCDIINFSILLCLLLFGIRFGILGVCIAVLISSVIGFFMFFGILSRLIQISFLQIFHAIATNTAVSSLMFISVYIIRLILLKANYTEVSVLMASMLSGVLIYLILSLTFKSNFDSPANGQRAEENQVSSTSFDCCILHFLQKGQVFGFLRDVTNLS